MLRVILARCTISTMSFSGVLVYCHAALGHADAINHSNVAHRQILEEASGDSQITFRISARVCSIGFDRRWFRFNANACHYP